ncbi:MAG TPA: YncE family protein [Vicinamibacterales bacterium]|nr:YncE family protein [Vicinamibacterales bacterium]
MSRLAAATAIVALAGVWADSPADLRAGFVLVANQQSASASLINLKDDSAKIIAVGNGPHEAVIAPSGRTGVVTIYGLAGAPGNELAVIDIARGSVTKMISLGQYTRPHGANFLPGDETRVAVTSETTRNVVIVNLTDGTVEHAIPTNAATSHMVAITADGTRAFTSNIGGGSVSELDLAASAPVRTIAVAPQVEGIAVTPDGGAVWAGSNANGTVSIIDTKTGTIAATLPGFSLPYRLAMSRDGRTAIVCDPQGDKLHVADVRARRIVWTLDGIGSPRGVNIAPDGKTAFVTLAADETMGVIDLETRKLTRKIKVQQSPDGVWYGPNPSQIDPR